MTDLQLQNIKKMFAQYVAQFTGDDDLATAINLKVEHCLHVADESRWLSRELGWGAEKQNIAEAMGLLHDVGRFSQFAEYRTFSDTVSVNHGERGADVVEQKRWLSDLSDNEHNAIMDGIRHHNALNIPETLSDHSLEFVKLIRDADKLDIFRVVLDSVERDGFKDLLEMLPHIVLNRSVTSRIIDEIVTTRKASMKNVKSLADLLLLQASWVYDFNFTPSIRRFDERGILDRIFSYIDKDSRIDLLELDFNNFIKNSD